MKILTKGILIVVSFLMTGCGGGGGGGGDGAPPPQASPAAGLWIGTTSDDRELGCLVLNNNALFCIYSASGDPALITGVVQGSGTVSGSTFSANNARDFDIEADHVVSGALSGTFNARQTFNGSVQPSGSTFEMSYDERFDDSADLSSVAGEFTGSAAVIPGDGGEAAEISVASNGAFAFAGGATTNGCQASGALSPRSDGNVFSIGLTFGAACLYEDETFNGIAFYDLASAELTVIVVNDARTAAGIFIGAKQ